MVAVRSRPYSGLPPVDRRPLTWVTVLGNAAIAIASLAVLAGFLYMVFDT